MLPYPEIDALRFLRKWVAEIPARCPYASPWSVLLPGTPYEPHVGAGGEFSSSSLNEPPTMWVAPGSQRRALFGSSSFVLSVAAASSQRSNVESQSSARQSSAVVHLSSVRLYLPYLDPLAKH